MDRIKETVARALKSCQECKNNSLQAKEEFLNQSKKELNYKKKTSNNDTPMPLLDNRQFEQAVIQAKQRLNDPNGVSYADVARSAIDDDSQIQSKQQSIHPEVKNMINCPMVIKPCRSIHQLELTTSQKITHLLLIILNT